MNKAELIDSIGEIADISKQAAKDALEAVLESIGTSLKKNESVVIPGFGTFDVKERAARTGRHPRTGEPLEIPKSWSVHFKVGKNLKDEVNEANK